MTSKDSKEATITAGQLYTIAGGLNIEGGLPGKDSKKWANLVLVLDRPLVDNVVFDSILERARKHKYQFLESAVDEIDEHRFLIAYLAILAYYMHQHKSITVHVHQFPEFKGLLNTMKAFAVDVRQHFGVETRVDYRMDNPFYTPQKYDTDLTISISQCAGLDAKLEAGALIVPNRFVEFDTKALSIGEESYSANVLVDDLAKILSSPYHEFAVRSFKKYGSANSAKKHEARPLTPSDFHFSKILRVSEIWNPTDPNQSIKMR